MEILYQDDRLVAVHKPAGLLVHRSAIDRRETRFALQLTRDQVGQPVFPVHRLDKPVSGVLLFALDRETARRLGDAFADGRVQKIYLAVVRGYTELGGRIDYALCEQLDPMTDARAAVGKSPQTALTDYRRLATVELPVAVGRYPTARYSLLQLQPQTGRKHQLRRHLKHIRHPIVGDTTHGDGKHNRLFRDHLGSQRLLLASVELRLDHPDSGALLCISASLAADFVSVLAALGWQGSGFDPETA